MEPLENLRWSLEALKRENKIIQWSTVCIFLVWFLIETMETLNGLYNFLSGGLHQFLSAVSPIVNLLTLGWLIFLGWKLLGIVHEMYKMIRIQTDQSSVRLIEGKTQITSELERLIQDSNSIKFYGPVDDNYNFAETIRRCTIASKNVAIYDTLLDSSKTSLESLIEMDRNSGSEFGYFACLYKQLVGVVIGEANEKEKQLLFFKNSADNELKGVLINKNYRISLQHVTEDLVKGIGPCIDFKGQVFNIKKALRATLSNYWEPMAKYGWIAPVMPPKVDKSRWEKEILEFFQNTAIQFANTAKKIVITWRIVDKSLEQASTIVTWLVFLRDTFSQREGCSVERVVLVDENRYRGDSVYKDVVDTIRSTYFPSADSQYSVKYHQLASEIEGDGDGYDFGIFYNSHDEIIAVQGSTYDSNHEKLLRIYFDRSDNAKNKCKEKVTEIEDFRVVILDLN